MKPMRSKAERYAMALVFAGITAVWSGIVWTTALQLIARYAVERCPPAGIASSKTEPSDSDLTNLNLPPDLATKVEEMASPNPHTIRLRCKERIEYAHSVLGGNSGSGVLDRYQHGRLTAETGFKLQPSRFRGRGAHCIDRVSDEIQEYLLEFHAIYLHLGKIAVKLSTDRYLVDLKIMF